MASSSSSSLLDEPVVCSDKEEDEVDFIILLTCKFRSGTIVDAKSSGDLILIVVGLKPPNHAKRMRTITILSVTGVEEAGGDEDCRCWLTRSASVLI